MTVVEPFAKAFTLKEMKSVKTPCFTVVGKVWPRRIKAIQAASNTVLTTLPSYYKATHPPMKAEKEADVTAKAEEETAAKPKAEQETAAKAKPEKAAAAKANAREEAAAKAKVKEGSAEAGGANDEQGAAKRRRLLQKQFPFGFPLDTEDGKFFCQVAALSALERDIAQLPDSAFAVLRQTLIDIGDHDKDMNSIHIHFPEMSADRQRLLVHRVRALKLKAKVAPKAMMKRKASRLNCKYRLGTQRLLSC